MPILRESTKQILREKLNVSPTPVATPVTPAASTIHDGAQFNFRRYRTSEVYGNYNLDAKDIITDYDREQLVNKARYFVENLPLMKASLEEIATYSIGGAFMPVFQGEDKEWGKTANEFLKKWYKSVDLYGNDMHTVLWMTSIALDRDGDIGIQLSAVNDGKYPIINVIPCHRIASKEEKVNSGPFAGLPIYDGVILNEKNRPVGYNVIASTTDSETVEYSLSKSNMMLLCEPRYPSQIRGYPTLASCLNDLMDYRDIKDYEREAIKQASAISLIEKNEIGGVLPGDMQFGITSSFTNQVDQSNQPIYWRYYNGGTVRYFGSNDPNAGLSQMQNNRPGDLTQTFLRDHVLRGAFNSIGWSLEIAWDMSGLNSANTRTILAKVERKLTQRQATLMKMWKRVVTYVLAKAIKQGFLKDNPDWYKWTATLPKSPSIDLGRDTKSDLDLLKVCGTTLSSIAGKSGDQFEDVVNRRTAEMLYIKEKADEAGIPFELLYSTVPNPVVGETDSAMQNKQE